MWSNIKTVVEKHLLSKNVWYTYILLVDDLTMKYLCTYWPNISKQTSINKSTSKRKLFKK